MGILLRFIFRYRRYYDVFIQELSFIVGKDKVRRNKAYIFTVGEGRSGATSYRIGEDGPWKLVFPDEHGTYVIP
ncbi:MAG: hypothetical protein FWG41_05525 [Methanomassiliicoccaceae archaeon]|nr:hypothetical protein [Methanomassiliicoccaceae archaeon]